MNTNRIYINNRKELINDMLEFKGYVYCEFCNSSNSFKFHSHHIIFRSEKPNHVNLHDKENLIIVCDKCHEIFHNEKSLRNRLVEDRKLYKLFGNDVRNK